LSFSRRDLRDRHERRTHQRWCENVNFSFMVWAFFLMAFKGISCTYLIICCLTWILTTFPRLPSYRTLTSRCFAHLMPRSVSTVSSPLSTPYPTLRSSSIRPLNRPHSGWKTRISAKAFALVIKFVLYGRERRK
jgi:hypothetical protein